MKAIAAALLLASSVCRADDFTSLLGVGRQEVLTWRAADVQASQRRKKWDQRVREMLGPFETMLREPGTDAGGMIRAVVEGLRAGRFDTVIMGESHSVRQEKAAADALLHAIAGAGLKIGALLSETTTVLDGKTESEAFLIDGTDWLEARGVPRLKMHNLVRPNKDVIAGLEAAKDGILVTYTGNAHAGKRIDDWIFDDLGDALGSFKKGGLRMITLEESARDHGRKPVVVSMIAESYIRSKIDEILRREIVGKGGKLEDLQADLEAALSAWGAHLASGRPASTDIRFVTFPTQEDLIVGITPDGRPPRELAACLEALRSPELAAWLGAREIASVEAGAQGSDDGQGHVTESVQVTVKSQDGELFSRLVPSRD